MALLEPGPPPRNDRNQANASQNDVKRVVSRRGNESKDSFTGREMCALASDGWKYPFD